MNCRSFIESETWCIIFSLLEYVQGRIAFISLSIALRVLEAVGASSAVVSGFALIGTVFPENVGTVFVSTIFYLT